MQNASVAIEGRFVRRQLRRAVLLGCPVFFCSCAAREVTPVRITQGGDEALACMQLQQQIAGNQTEETKLLVKDKEVERGNVAKTVGAAIPYVGIAIAAQADLSNEEQVKARALADRNEWLRILVKRKGCAE
jgi:hypothetical protein